MSNINRRPLVLAGIELRGVDSPTDQSSNYEGVMSKGMDQKKSQKKEPAKTLKEKRAAKQEKKAK
ncbi:hypothetical protein [Xanthomonas hortorum]|uniref:Uncharacterized protein n=1 Tax=Xanthomonas hortorum pv. hederae TaxID=453603 RepID=A0A9X4BV86_9XANT|nr:hypothetical protein [Xanthomonas hortorum]MCE4372830.1 hypothetical protein [Xanthomonas hortorum pv. hederae]MDC8640202.1 hypothetical protein [Xanthomonas hortorum pv. hederae]